MAKPFAYAAVALLAMLSVVAGPSAEAVRADTKYDRLKSILGDKDQLTVARALSQAAALARICKRQIDYEQFQNAMRISGIEAQDLAEGGKLFGSTQDGRASVDATGCNGADGSFGPDGAEIPGILR